MTTAAMVLGVVPLIAASDAGAVSRFDTGLVIASGLSIGSYCHVQKPKRCRAHTTAKSHKGPIARARARWELGRSRRQISTRLCSHKTGAVSVSARRSGWKL